MAGGATQVPMTCTNAWDSPGSYALAFAPDGSIFSANYQASRVVHYSQEGSELSSWSQPAGQSGMPFWPCGIDVDAEGNVLVSNFSEKCVQKFSPDGTLLATIGSGLLTVPRGIACDRGSGHVFVCDNQGSAIREFSPLGELVRSVPVDWYASDVALGSAGELYVCAFNGRVYRFAADGSLMTTWQPDDAGPSTAFHSITRDPNGRIHVVDTGANRVIVLTSELQRIGQWSLDCAGLNIQCRDGEGYNKSFLTGIDVNGQGVAVLGADCLLGQVAVFPQITVATRVTTWGALKSIYR